MEIKKGDRVRLLEDCYYGGREYGSKGEECGVYGVAGDDEVDDGDIGVMLSNGNLTLQRAKDVELIQSAPCRRLAAINTALSTNHADLDTALAALMEWHGEMRGALAEAREALEDALCVVQGGPIHRAIDAALAAIRKVAP